MKMVGSAGASGFLPLTASAKLTGPKDLYETTNYGNVTFMHITDTHAQLNPVYFREPSINIGVGDAYGKPPHLVGYKLLEKYGIKPGSAEAHAFTYLNFAEESEKFGKIGGFAHLATLIKRVRAERGADRCMLLDGGDTWQGSATSLWTKGMDMVGACNLLGVDAMTGHWEFTYQDTDMLKNVEAFNGEFLAQNINVKESALMDDAIAYDEDTGHRFKPYMMKEMNGQNICVIGQAFPYVPVANPSSNVPEWEFGIKDAEMQELIDDIKENEKPDAILVLSHNGADVDLKLASRVSGITAILGGHTHDAIPRPVEVRNPGGVTLVINSGSNGKFLSILDLDIKNHRVVGWKFNQMPVFSNLIEADSEMTAYINNVRKPFEKELNRKVGVTESLLYRRGNFNGTFDQVICDALNQEMDTQFSLSPGFRWGTSLLPGQDITMEHIMDQTSTTYSECYARDMTGDQLRNVLEGVAENLFQKDPYLQSGGDMVRTGGLLYTLDANAALGNRISNLRDYSGKLVNASKSYKVSGWADVSLQAEGPQVWDVVADYVSAEKRVRVNTDVLHPNTLGLSNNPGIGHKHW
jgi:sulfur-oxidizing protein SoxB